METLSILEEVINRKARKEAIGVLCKINRKLYDAKHKAVGWKPFEKLSKKNKQTSKWFNSLAARINIEIKKLDKK